MRKISDTIKSNPLFQEIAFSDFERILKCLSVKKIEYKKDDVIILSGDAIDFIGLIL